MVAPIALSACLCCAATGRQHVRRLDDEGEEDGGLPSPSIAFVDFPFPLLKALFGPSLFALSPSVQSLFCSRVFGRVFVATACHSGKLSPRSQIEPVTPHTFTMFTCHPSVELAEGPVPQCYCGGREHGCSEPDSLKFSSLKPFFVVQQLSFSYLPVGQLLKR